ncbi:MAG: hypothetical protein RL582_2078 [Bacteroidota bacterium]
MSIELPSDFIASVSILPNMDVDAFVQAHAEPLPVSIRVNPAKKIETQTHFDSLNPTGIPWAENGYYLEERPSFTLDPLFHAGCYYVQEAGSMFLEQAIKKIKEQSDILRVLDLCAAPGGKSTHLQSILSSASIIVSNEVIKPRQNILMENWVKWGAKNALVTGNDARDFQRLPDYFDLIVVDAPCSGSGMFRKDTDSISHWSPAHVEHCAQRQERILQDVFPALKPGGYLVYSTCSYSELENEVVLDYLLSQFSMESIQIPLHKDWGITETQSKQHGGFGYRCYPHKSRGEGFFLTLLRKKGGYDQGVHYPHFKSNGKMGTSSPKTIQNQWEEWIQIKEGETLMDWKGQLLIMNQTIEKHISEIQQNLYIRSAGVYLGSAGNKGFIPEHGLAMSGNLPASFPRFELEREDALQLLRHQTVGADIKEKGWMLMTHKSHALSLVKSLPNRINNYYPREWRILNK